MARRRPHADGDSLELLLDTICNVFGGIILMAILVILQTQVSAGRLPSRDPAAVTRNREYDRLRSSVDRISRQIADLEAESRRLADLIRDNPTSPEIRRLAKTAEDLQGRVDRTRTQVDDAQDQAAAHFEEIAVIQAHIDKARKDLGEARTRDGRRNLKQVHLPIQSKEAARGNELCFVIRGDRAYGLPPAFSQSSVPGLGGGCRIKTLRAGSLTLAELTPVDGQGIPAPGADTGRGRFVRALRAARPVPGYVVLLVYDDSGSFEAFQQFKAAVMAKGVPYVIGLKANPGLSFVIPLGKGGEAPHPDG